MAELIQTTRSTDPRSFSAWIDAIADAFEEAWQDERNNDFLRNIGHVIRRRNVSRQRLFLATEFGQEECPRSSQNDMPGSVGEPALQDETAQVFVLRERV
jgi:hypothetical protein